MFVHKKVVVVPHKQNSRMNTHFSFLSPVNEVRGEGEGASIQVGGGGDPSRSAQQVGGTQPIGMLSFDISN